MESGSDGRRSGRKSKEVVDRVLRHGPGAARKACLCGEGFSLRLGDSCAEAVSTFGEGRGETLGETRAARGVANGADVILEPIRAAVPDDEHYVAGWRRRARPGHRMLAFEDR